MEGIESVLAQINLLQSNEFMNIYYNTLDKRVYGIINELNAEHRKFNNIEQNVNLYTLYVTTVQYGQLVMENDLLQAVNRAIENDLFHTGETVEIDEVARITINQQSYQSIKLVAGEISFADYVELPIGTEIEIATSSIFDTEPVLVLYGSYEHMEGNKYKVLGDLRITVQPISVEGKRVVHISQVANQDIVAVYHGNRYLEDFVADYMDTIEVVIEPHERCIAGELLVNGKQVDSTITIDKDIEITATPATKNCLITVNQQAHETISVSALEVENGAIVEVDCVADEGYIAGDIIITGDYEMVGDKSFRINDDVTITATEAREDMVSVNIVQTDNQLIKVIVDGAAYIHDFRISRNTPMQIEVVADFGYTHGALEITGSIQYIGDKAYAKSDLVINVGSAIRNVYHVNIVQSANQKIVVYADAIAYEEDFDIEELSSFRYEIIADDNYTAGTIKIEGVYDLHVHSDIVISATPASISFCNVKIYQKPNQRIKVYYGGVVHEEDFTVPYNGMIAIEVVANDGWKHGDLVIDGDYDYVIGNQYVVRSDLRIMVSSAVSIVRYLSLREYAPKHVYQYYMTDEIPQENIDYLKGVMSDEVRITDMYGMFAYCYLLQNIDLSYFRTSYVENMGHMFYGDALLKKIDVGSFDTSNVRDMSEMFSHCDALEEVELRGFRTPLVENMEGMFFNCKALKRLHLWYMDTNNVRNMKNMFRGCESLEWMIFSFDTLNVDTMEGMFCGCKKFPVINTYTLETGNVKTMRKMFKDCESLQTIYVNNFDMRKVEDISYMFAGCLSLNVLDVSRWQTDNLKDMSYMFGCQDGSCASLDRLDLRGLNTSDVVNMKGLFYGCNKLWRLWQDFDVSNVQDMSYMFYNCTALYDFDFSEWNTSSLKNMAYMFAGVRELGTVDIVFDTSNVVDMEGAFMDCGKTRVLHIDFNTSNVKTMKRMFMGNAWLKDIDLEGFNTFKVVDMSQMFDSCNSMEGFELSFDMSAVESIYRMFAYCGMAKEFVLEWNTANLKNVAFAFAWCTAVEELDLSSSSSSWTVDKVEDMQSLFHSCVSLKNVDITGWNTSQVKNMAHMFRNCFLLEHIEGIIDMQSCEMYEGMFVGCRNLSDVRIANAPEGFDGAGLDEGQYILV